jgi:hypothetical protein
VEAGEIGERLLSPVAFESAELVDFLKQQPSVTGIEQAVSRLF